MSKVYLKVPYFKQDTDYSCGPACLQMVFAYYHKRASEVSLIQQLRTNGKIGTTPGWMISIVRKYGFYAYVSNDSSFEEIRYFLDIGKPVVVYFVEPVTHDDHYAVVVGMENGNIILNDPMNGKQYTITKKSFDRCWHGEKKYQKNLRRWILVISPDEIPMGRQYKPFPGFIKQLI